MEIRNVVVYKGIIQDKKTKFDHYLKGELDYQKWQKFDYKILEYISKNITHYGDIYVVAIICAYSLNNFNLLKIIIFISCSLYMLISMLGERNIYGGFRYRTTFFARFFLFLQPAILIVIFMFTCANIGLIEFWQLTSGNDNIPLIVLFFFFQILTQLLCQEGYISKIIGYERKIKLRSILSSLCITYLRNDKKIDSMMEKKKT